MRQAFNLLTIFLLLAFSVQTHSSQSKLALVIGNANYQGAKLGTPVNDADDMAHALAQVGFKVDKLTDASQRQMERGIERFTAKLNPDSIAVFYYSGHAVEVRGQNYLLPVGKKITTEANVKYDAVNVGRLLDNLKATNKGLNLVVLDSCRDNPLEKGSKSGRYGLAQLAAPSGSLVAYATAPGKVALTGTGRNSIYTQALLKHLKTPDLEISDMLKRVSAEVKKATEQKQRPWISSDYTGQFAFVGDAGDKDKLYVAVLDFNVSGMDQAWGKVAKSLLVQSLNKTGKFRTFDRSGTVRNIAEEFHLQGSELMEDSVAKQLKRMYSVEGFVAGEIISLGGQYFVSLKLVGTTSEIKTANLDFSTATLSPDDLRARMPGLAAQLTGAQEVASIAPTRVFSGKYTLTVRSNVIGDKVFIDGKDYGATRLDVALEPGEHSIKIEKAGYESYETSIQLASNQTVRGVLAQIGDSSKLSTSGAEQQPVKRAVISPGARGMIRIKGRRFDMGSPSYEGGRDSDEVLHSVSVRGFQLAKTEVTVGQFRKFTDATGYRTDAERNQQKDGCFSYQSGEWAYQAGRSWRDPGFRQTNAHPVVCMSFSDAMAYIDWLNRTSGQRYRLPTEAEWEYAARAGTSTARYWGDSSNSACDYANVYDNAGKSHYNFSRQHHGCNDGYAATAPVGSFQGNAWGLKDMLGNVWEWTCSDWNTSYEGQEKQCSGNNHASGKRSVRGGAWNNGPAWVRSANRTGFYSWTRYDNQGFRLAQDL